MKRPICVKCQTEFRNIKSGIAVIDMFSDPPEPYQVWLADLFECPTCKTQIVSGFGDRLLVRHHDVDFKQHLRFLRERFEVRNYEHPEDANPVPTTKNEALQRLVEAIGRHEPMANDPAIIDAINAIEDILCKRSE